MTDNGWGEHKKLVEFRLNEHTEQLNRLVGQISSIERTLGRMEGASKVKTAVWSIGLPLLVSTVVSIAGLVYAASH